MDNTAKGNWPAPQPYFTYLVFEKNQECENVLRFSGSDSNFEKFKYVEINSDPPF
jgi:hypothetical protein